MKGEISRFSLWFCYFCKWLTHSSYFRGNPECWRKNRNLWFVRWRRHSEIPALPADSVQHSTHTLFTTWLLLFFENSLEKLIFHQLDPNSSTVIPSVIRCVTWEGQPIQRLGLSPVYILDAQGLHHSLDPSIYWRWLFNSMQVKNKTRKRWRTEHKRKYKTSKINICHVSLYSEFCSLFRAGSLSKNRFFISAGTQAARRRIIRQRREKEMKSSRVETLDRDRWKDGLDLRQTEMDTNTDRSQCQQVPSGLTPGQQQLLFRHCQWTHCRWNQIRQNPYAEQRLRGQNLHNKTTRGQNLQNKDLEDWTSI